MKKYYEKAEVIKMLINECKCPKTKQHTKHKL